MAVGSVENPYAGLGFSTETDLRKPKDTSLDQEDFLKLLSTQLQNQDPMAPMENGDFMGQMAQFGTVSGVHDLQKSFDNFASSIFSNQALQASSMIGRTGYVEGNVGWLEEGGQLNGAVDLPSSVPNLQVTIIGPDGQVVDTVNMGAQAPGMVQFSWDGVLPDGTTASPGDYQVVAEAGVGGTNTAFGTLMAANIESVNLGGGNRGITLNLAGYGAVNFNDIRQIR